jgi:hypothetical protein
MVNHVSNNISRSVLAIAAASLSSVRVLTVVLLIGSGVLLGGCTSNHAPRSAASAAKRAAQVVSPLTLSVERPEKLTSINCVAVARPVFVRAVEDRTLSEESIEAVIERVADEVLSLKVVTSQSMLSKGDRSGALIAPDSSVGLSTLRERGVDAVLMTELSDFKDRSGSSIGGDPATVSFVMTIKSTDGGAVIWRAHYFYRQEALSENLLKLGDRLGSGGTGAGWVTGRAIFERGVDMALRDFGSRREALFLSASPSAAISANP